MCYSSVGGKVACTAIVFFFFFSSRRRHTRYWRDWSSDVCSSDLARSGLRRRLSDVGMPDSADDSAGERLVLAFDELASNALRHGEVPVVATVVAGTGGWLLDVSDRAPDHMPQPAVDRDPAYGGMGLHMVARMSVAHGWYVDDGAKHVWACLPSSLEDRSPSPALV